MYVFVSDFDGTITYEDFFTLISQKYFNESMLSPWRAYLDGHKTHFEALNEMFAKIHIDEAGLKAFIRKIKFDKIFFEVCELCNSKKIPIYICSAGCDYYINELIGQEIKKYNITLITNHGVYSKKDGLKMIAPDKNSPYYNKDVGISKKAIIEHLHNKGYITVFAGDGPPDFAPAKLSNVVFARKILLERCRQAGITTEPFDSFAPVYNYFLEIKS